MNRKELVSALDLANKCSIENKIIPILGYLCFDKTTIQSFNGVQGISVPFDSGLEFTVKTDLFSNLVDSFSSDLIDLDKTSIDFVTLKQGKSTNKVAILDNSNFISPFPKARKGKLVVTIDDNFIDGMKKCLATTLRNNVRESQNGITIKNSKDGFFMYSTDGARISKYTFATTCTDTFELILPDKFCRLLVSLYETDKDTTLLIDTDSVIATLKSCELYTHINNTLKIENFEGVLTKYGINSLTFEDIPELFREAVSRGIIITKGNRKATLTLEKKKIKIEVNSVQAEMEEEIDMVTPLMNQSFDVDLDLLAGTLSVIKDITFVSVPKGYIIAGSDTNFVTMLGTSI